MLRRRAAIPNAGTPSRDETRIRLVGGSPSTAQIDIVFVHGLAGDGISTWVSPAAIDSFPEWVAHDFGTTAVWSLHYPAAATKWRSRGEGMEISERAKSLIPWLLNQGIGKRKTIFICHSLGGLLVKQILRHSAEKKRPGWESIVESTLGVVFLATPHTGSFLANVADRVPFFRPTRTTLALSANSSTLQELDEWYRNNVGEFGIQTDVYAESQRLRRFFRWVRVVNATSSDPHIPGCSPIPVDADHVDICKLNSRETTVYVGVSLFLRRQLDRVAGGVDAGGEVSHVDAEMSKIAPNPDLVRRIRELQALRDQIFQSQVQLDDLIMGIVRNHVGVDDE